VTDLMNKSVDGLREKAGIKYW